MIKPPPETPFTFLSLGAGVQSSALALMASAGWVKPMPDAAIFADTQAEPRAVYEWLDWLEKQLQFPVIRVTRGSLTKAALDMRTTEDGRVFTKTDIPFFTKNSDGSFGMIPQRACTMDYKIQPIRKKVKELAGIKRGQKEITVTQWIGISWDEIQRMKDSRDPWQQNRFPLLERRMTRRDILDWMREHGYPTPPRSACAYCPFHSDREWRKLDAESFAMAVKFEKDVQAAKATIANFASTPYLHRSRQPLDQVDFSTDDERGQELLGFMEECEGMCGL